MTASLLSADFQLETTALDALKYSPRERSVIHLKSLLTLAVMYTSVYAASKQPWLLPLAFAITAFGSIRYSGYIHALDHAYRLSDPVPFLLELQPSLWSPFIAGFREVQRVHLTHHQHETGAGDPDNWLIAGNSRLLIVLKCAFVFEYWFFYAFKQGWFTPRTYLGWAIRLAAITAFGFLVGWKMMLFFALSAKFGTAISFYVFSYLGHVSEGTRGNYLLSMPRTFAAINHFLIGAYAAEPATLHALHHRKPWVSCGKLEWAYERADNQRNLQMVAAE